ncbi:MAG: hypothetical protein H0T71_00460 [Acidobacteria bacterium]|nr:hypothetical protein [Acidobacteriota bacterium]
MLRSRPRVLTAVVVVIVLTAGVWVAWDRLHVATPQEAKAETKAQKPKSLDDDDRKVTDEQRAEMLGRAHVWRTPAVPIAHASFVGEGLETLSCKFKLSDLGGTTPKFDCTLEDGQKIRIKYGKGPEIPAEAAATRLLKALGFGADDIALVEKVHCYGCPEEPFSTMKVVEVTGAGPLYKNVIDYNDVEEFTWVALERKFSGRPVETDQVEGWSFFELDLVDAAKGGAPRAHVDALRLMAVFLSHWDNKSENQRLVCLSAHWPKDTRCSDPFLLLQDVGATFGPVKVDLDAWGHAPIWEDRPSCTVSMIDLPYDGATFGKAHVTEAGRQFIGRLLTQLSDPQITELFAGARFNHERGIFSAARPVSDWVRTFKSKVSTITEGPACPEA